VASSWYSSVNSSFRWFLVSYYEIVALFLVFILVSVNSVVFGVYLVLGVAVPGFMMLVV